MSADGPRGPLHRFRTKIAAALMLTAVLSVVLMAVIGVRLIRQAEERVAIAELRRQAATIGGEAAILRGQPRQTLKLLRRALNLNQAAVFRFDGRGGLVLVDGDPNVELTDADARRLASGQTVEGKRDTPAGDALFVARPIGTGVRRRVLVVGRTAGFTEGSLPIGPRILLAALVAAAAASVIALFLSNRIARPLRELAGAARDIAKGDFKRRVPVTSDDEIGVVAESFNTMAAELGAADTSQRDFFLSISHELRTPLTAIQGYAEAIEDGTASGDRLTEAAGVIVAESKRLTRLVSDLLDLARIDAQRFQVSMEPVEVGQVLKSVQQSFAPKAEEGSVTIVVEGGEATVTADRDRLVQVLSNLVENALRYTPAKGTIALSASTAGGWVRLQVADTGPGFQVEDFGRAFERQYLWNKYRGLRDVGTGLGLAITKELTEAMGGRVGASTAPGGGAVFVVELLADG